MMKKFPKLDDLVGKPGKASGPARQSADEIETTMRRWRAVMSQATTQGKGGRHG